MEIVDDEIISTGLPFSSEYLFFNYGFTKKSLKSYIITTSNTYKKYGKYVTRLIILSEEEMPQIMENTKNEINNDRII